jgi:hypothetical protein
MKMIVRISATKQPAWRVLEHVYGEGDYRPERRINSRLGPRCYQLEAGVPTGDAKFDSKLLLAAHHGRGKEVRHVIFSGQEMPDANEADYQQAIQAVIAAAHDFAAVHAPGQAYIIQGHLDRFHPHAHMILCASNGMKCIDWGPQQLKGFQSLDYLSAKTKSQYQLEPGRGAGKRKPSVGRLAYDNAVNGEHHKTQDRQTAEQFSYAKVLEGIKAGTIEVSRRAKSGKPLSVLLGGKKIRLSTLRKTATTTSNPQGTNHDSARPSQNRSHRLPQRRGDRRRTLAR